MHYCPSSTSYISNLLPLQSYITSLQYTLHYCHCSAFYFTVPPVHPTILPFQYSIRYCPTATSYPPALLPLKQILQYMLYYCPSRTLYITVIPVISTLLPLQYILYYFHFSTSYITGPKLFFSSFWLIPRLYRSVFKIMGKSQFLPKIGRNVYVTLYCYRFWHATLKFIWISWFVFKQTLYRQISPFCLNKNVRIKTNWNKENNNSELWHVTHDTWHVTHDISKMPPSQKV